MLPTAALGVDVRTVGGPIAIPDDGLVQPVVAAAGAGPMSGAPYVHIPVQALPQSPGLTLSSTVPSGSAAAERVYSRPADPTPRFNPLAFLAGSGSLTAPGGVSSAFVAVLASSLLLALALVASKRVCLDALRLPSQGYAPLLPPG